MFLGTYTPKLDEKGRFFLPAKFREELDEGLVITRGQEHCLAVYPMSTFMEMTREIAKGSVSVKKVRDYQRMLAAGASDTAADKQGRVMVPPMLRRYAGLGKEIVIVGAITRIEIWDAARWEEYSTAQEADFAQMNEEVFADE
ncbi:MAG: division/cell wall cluster transcriptional repressor MraZ [Cutibacterium granulosum]|uniref:division/cell wall cluster transcriptional repressor MraZ n=1 Tax=Cutibacterium granulosum TaxID=33011 RepID=UPI00290BE5E3|nr:division/cell wall cluster transcriptional repressor MraZ [Cutibacterium granulosum]MDU6339500.1 division/cell wall cluster transcriptional repressor MraZ [Cutibacterium granulosum]MEA5634030.1 division/cell wall cluster transcriptional repressor MraZ [Cutibacterium granulosum]MEA5659114.1 division/cell wall cluster transcriptional repressor MraZ [Cutibacterium granulosum]MEA5661032.1 division/cell wall cluster transcriptional repressor MraZ [Cutibacterium granulosum]